MKPAEARLHQELELLSDRSLPGSDRSRIGHWVLRADRGATGRANSLWPCGTPGVELCDGLDQAEAWFGERALNPHVMIFSGCNPALVSELERRGYQPRTGAEVMVASLADLALGPPPPASTRWTVRQATEPTEATAFLTGDDDRLAENATTRLPQRYVEAFSDDDLLGGGIGTVDADWIGLFAMKTLLSARRQGVASHILRHLIEAGRTAGASKAWLQVMPDNHGAKALYANVGFKTVHAYHYLVAPGGASPGGC